MNKQTTKPQNQLVHKTFESQHLTVLCEITFVKLFMHAFWWGGSNWLNGSFGQTLNHDLRFEHLSKLTQNIPVTHWPFMVLYFGLCKEKDIQITAILITQFTRTTFANAIIFNNKPFTLRWLCDFALFFFYFFCFAFVFLFLMISFQHFVRFLSSSSFSLFFSCTFLLRLTEISIKWDKNAFTI